MNKKLGIAILALTLLGCGGPSASGSFTEDKDPTVNFQDAIAIWWPEAGDSKNCLDVTFFNRKLSEEERKNYPDQLVKGDGFPPRGDLIDVLKSFADSKAPKPRYGMWISWKEAPESFKVEGATAIWARYFDGGWLGSPISNWGQDGNELKLSGGPKEGSTVSLTVKIKTKSITVDASATQPLLFKSLKAADLAPKKPAISSLESYYKGPVKPLGVKVGGRAWAVVQSPNGSEGLTCFVIGTVEKAEPGKALIKYGENQCWTPNAFVRPLAPAKGVKVGSHVLAVNKNGQGIPCLVIGLEKDGLTGVSRNDFNEDEVIEARLSEVVSLDGPEGFATPMAFSDPFFGKGQKRWKGGNLLFRDGKRIWVGGYMAKPTEFTPEDVHPVRYSQFKAGQTVWKLDWMGCANVTIEKVLPQDRGYTIKGQGGQPQTLTFKDLAAPFK